MLVDPAEANLASWPLSAQLKWLRQNPKSEGRNPKEIRSPKPETAPALVQPTGEGSPLTSPATDAALRDSDFGLLSDFELRTSDFKSVNIRPAENLPARYGVTCPRTSRQ